MEKRLNMFLVLALLLAPIFLTGCGVFQKMYDGASYKSITGEKGDFHQISGGKIMFEYKNATVEYSNTDTQTLLIRTAEGERKYLQGDIQIDLYKR